MTKMQNLHDILTKNHGSPATQLRKASIIVSQFPDSTFLRKRYYEIKKMYKTLCSAKKENYFAKTNAEIENGKILNWKQFKKLKNLKNPKTAFDTEDMSKFENFFSKLYANEQQTSYT